jgi:hypothetical protein
MANISFQSVGWRNSGRTRCYFDVYAGRQVYRDQSGVDVPNVGDVARLARTAIAEFRREEVHDALFGVGALLVVRVTSNKTLYVMALDD